MFDQPQGVERDRQNTLSNQTMRCNVKLFKTVLFNLRLLFEET